MLRIFFLLIFLLFPPSSRALQDPLLLTFIDVGEGDCLFIRTPENLTAIVDTGNPMTGPGAAKYVQSKETGEIHLLFLTHPHLDHFGGVFTFLKFFDVKSLIDNGQDLGNPPMGSDMARWYLEGVRDNARYRAVSAGEKLKLGDLKIDVLWPAANIGSGDWNTNTMVLLLQYGSFSALLMGDANHRTEKGLMESSQAPGAVKLLKAGHHASKQTAGKAFLKRVSPLAAVVSVNNRNIRGYPDAGTISRYEKAGVRVFRTDISGTIEVKAFPSGSFHVMNKGRAEVF